MTEDDHLPKHINDLWEYMDLPSEFDNLNQEFGTGEG